MELTPSIREYVEGKVDRLRKIFDNIQKIDIILSSDKLKRGEADLIVAATQGTLKCTARDVSPMSAFDIAMEKMERQLQRHKARIIGNKKHLRENPRRQLSEPETAGKPVGVPNELLLDEDMPTPQAINPEKLSVREAMDRFQASNYEVMVFVDVDTQAPSVLFRDHDGDNRLLEIRSGNHK